MALSLGLAVPTVLAASRGVAIRDFAFSPRTVEIRVGDTVTWTNRDSVAHTATARNGSFDTGTLADGESGSVRFTSAGRYRFLCTPHPQMTGTVVVRAARTGVVPPDTSTAVAVGSGTTDSRLLLLAAVAGLVTMILCTLVADQRSRTRNEAKSRLSRRRYALRATGED